MRKAYDALAAALQDHDPKVRHAAAEALGSLSDPAAVEILKTHATGMDMAMRVAAVKGLVALKAPFDPEWLTVVIRGAANVNDQNFHEAIRLIRLYAPNDAKRALAACVKFDDPSPRTSYNMFLLLAIDAGPQGYYSRFYSDPNTDGTPEQIENNRKVLAGLKQWLEKQRHPEPQAAAGRCARHFAACTLLFRCTSPMMANLRTGQSRKMRWACVEKRGRQFEIQASPSFHGNTW